MLLPPDRAFLVRLDADADPECGPLFGRVEHLTSGKRAEFTSAEELAGFIKEIVTQCGHSDANRFAYGYAG